MKQFKHGISLVLVLVALVAASFGGEFGFTEDTPAITVDTTESPVSEELAGLKGFHW